jgi:hypothetical protein
MTADATEAIRFSPVQYRLVVGHPDYRVGGNGSVWSKKTRGCKCRGRGARWVTDGPWTLLDAADNGRGYRSVNIDGKTRKVHQLVLEAFVGPRPPGMECRHLNDVKSDNRLENLAWGSHKKNGEDMARLGRSARGERHPKARLTEDDIRAIRRRRANGERVCVLARDFGINSAGICRIVSRFTWRHVAEDLTGVA